MPLPRGVSHDEYQLSTIDEAPRELILTIAIVLGAPCDADHLRQSLFDTIREKLPRCGARLIRLTSQTHAVQIPHAFTDEVPPAAFTVSNHVKETAPKLFPATPDSPAIISEDAHQPQLFRGHGTGCPIKFTDYLRGNVPVTYIHVARYSDATFIGVTVPHAVYDATSIGLLIRTWATATRGELDTVHPSPREFYPTSKAALEGVTPRVSEVNFRPLPLLRAMRFIVKYLWEMATDSSERRILFRIPKAWARAEKERVMSELTAGALDSQSDGNAKRWVSTYDVVAASLFRWAHMHHLQRASQTPIVLISALNLRPIIPEVGAHPVVGNMMFSAGCPPVPLAETLGSTTRTALVLREGITAMRSKPNQLRAEVAYNAALPPGRAMVFPCEPNHRWALVSSWLTAGVAEAEFCLSRARTETQRPKWSIGYTQDNDVPAVRHTCSIFSEDDDAYWAAWWLGKKDWKKVERALREDGEVLFV